MVVYQQAAGSGTTDGRSEHSEEEIDLLFHALADPTRRDIVRRSIIGGHSVSDLAAEYSISFAAVQKHVAVLERAGLVTKQSRGRERLVHTSIEAVRSAEALLSDLEELWRHRLERFGDVLAETAPPQPHPETLQEKT